MTKTYDILEVIAATYVYYPGMYITATTGGSHVSNSYHYRAEAIDVGSGLGTKAQNDFLVAHHISRWQAMDGLASYLNEESSLVTELFHGHQGLGGTYVKNGVRKSNAWGVATGLHASHKTHVHYAIASRADAIKVLTLIVQRRLSLHVDGSFGPKTTAAVKAFQSKSGLTPDGVVGMLTAAALRGV